VSGPCSPRPTATPHVMGHQPRAAEPSLADDGPGAEPVGPARRRRTASPVARTSDGPSTVLARTPTTPSSPVDDKVRHLDAAHQMEARQRLGLAASKSRRVPLRHERDVRAVHFQRAESAKGHRLAADADRDVVHPGVRKLRGLVDPSGSSSRPGRAEGSLSAAGLGVGSTVGASGRCPCAGCVRRGANHHEVCTTGYARQRGTRQPAV
jgi:hypothetical protein